MEGEGRSSFKLQASSPDFAETRSCQPGTPYVLDEHALQFQLDETREKSGYWD